MLRLGAIKPQIVALGKNDLLKVLSAGGEPTVTAVNGVMQFFSSRTSTSFPARTNYWHRIPKMRNAATPPRFSNRCCASPPSSQVAADKRFTPDVSGMSIFYLTSCRCCEVPRRGTIEPKRFRAGRASIACHLARDFRHASLMQQLLCRSVVMCKQIVPSPSGRGLGVTACRLRLGAHRQTTPVLCGRGHRMPPACPVECHARSYTRTSK